MKKSTEKTIKWILAILSILVIGYTSIELLIKYGVLK